MLAAAPACAGPSYAGFLASRPPEAEDAAIAGAARRRRAAPGAGARRCTCPAPPRSAGSPRPARAGVRVTVETCPHYLTLAAEDVPDGAHRVQVLPADPRRAPTATRLWGALDDGTDRLRRVRPLPRDGRPQVPRHRRLRRRRGAGSPRCSSGCRVVWTAARSRGVALADVVRWMSAAPAALVGLDGKGAIAVGNDADLVVFAPDATFRVDPARLHHRNPVTPYAGRELTRRGARRVAAAAGASSATGNRSAHPTGRLLRRSARMTDFTDAAPTSPRAPSAGAWSPPTTSSSPPRENLIKPEPAGAACTRSGTRARSTTAGRPGGGASRARTGRSSGWACPASCAAWSSTRRTSPATTRRSSRSRRRSSTATRAATELDDVDWTTLVPRSPARGDTANALRRRRRPGRGRTCG